MLTDTITRRSGAYRGADAGMRGLGSSCCSDCTTGGEGLGDLTSIGAVLTQSKFLDWLFVASLSIGAIAGSLAIYDHLKKKRRHPARRYTSPTMQIPTQSMHELVYPDEYAA